MDVIESDSEIDMDTVNDDIVEAVIRQLQATGNRPHLIKELSAILMLQLKSVQQYVPSSCSLFPVLHVSFVPFSASLRFILFALCTFFFLRRP